MSGGRTQAKLAGARLLEAGSGHALLDSGREDRCDDPVPDFVRRRFDEPHSRSGLARGRRGRARGGSGSQGGRGLDLRRRSAAPAIVHRRDRWAHFSRARHGDEGRDRRILDHRGALARRGPRLGGQVLPKRAGVRRRSGRSCSTRSPDRDVRGLTIRSSGTASGPNRDGAFQTPARTRRTSISRSTCSHSGDARSAFSSSSNAGPSDGAYSNHVRKSNGCSVSRSRQ